MIIGVIVAIIVIAGIAIAGAVVYDRQRKRAAYGPEYDLLVEQEGSPRAADRELARRWRAHSRLALRTLGPEDRARCADDWRRVQGSFVDDPGAALDEAEALVVRVARLRGYPGGDGEGVLELLSVAHPHEVAGYREAARVRRAVEQDSQSTSTEEMRQAFKKYAALFDGILAAAATEDGTRRTQTSDSRQESSLGAGR